ncbi:MAG: UvrD-helicase domain-containing protein [Proteobacteria bacterium]|nr:UvrD-helicase domain-containing protein [Pseudomonadota bacterium]
MSRPTFKLANTIVRAGAGAGKTTELVARVIDYVLQFHQKNQRLPALVVTTFTRKATAELKERILKEVLKREADQELLLRFVKSPSHLHISTIHGVLNLFLSQYGWYLGLAPQIQLIDPEQEKVLFKKSFRELLTLERNQAALNEVLESFPLRRFVNCYQRYQDWSEFLDLKVLSEQDLLQVAIDRAGKLQKMTQDLQKLILSETDKDKWVEYAQSLANLPSSKVTHTQDWVSWQQKVSSWFESLPKPVNRNSIVSDQVIDLKKDLHEEIKKLLSSSFSPEVWKDQIKLTRQVIGLCGELKDKIQAQKFNSSQMTIADLEDLALKLVREHPHTAQSFSVQWDHWMIDEFQDTSPKQVSLIDALMGKSLQFFVGDPQQSIYLFRGARAELFAERERILSEQGLCLKKSINYRSAPAVLQFFNEVMCQLSQSFQKMEPATDKVFPNQGTVEVLVPSDLNQENEEAQFDHVLARLQQLLQEQVPARSIAILARTNKDLVQLHERAEALGLPTALHQQAQFFENQEVQDALHLLQFLSNPFENQSLVQILRSPFFHLEDRELAGILRKNKSQHSYWVALQGLNHPSILSLRQALEDRDKFGMTRVWKQLLIEKGYFTYYREKESSGSCEANLWKLISILEQATRMPGFQVSEFLLNLQRSQVDLETSEGDAVPIISPDRIPLMTIHASKGLEFEHVFVLSCGSWRSRTMTESLMIDEASGFCCVPTVDEDEGKTLLNPLLEKLKEIRQAQEYSEYDRVFYVAITRAKSHLYLVVNKLDKQSWASRWGLSLDEGDHQLGSANYRTLKPELSSANLNDQSKKEISKPRLPLQVLTEQFQVRAVTSILEDREKKLESKQGIPAKPQSPEGLQKAVVGTQLHRYFESLKYVGLDFEQLKGSSELESATQNLFQSKKLDLKSIIHNGEVEFGFGIRWRKDLLQGQIDLWGRDAAGHVWVIDYKTGSPRHLEKAFSQLEVYTWALRKMNKINATEEVSLAVIYPFEEDPIRIKKARTQSEFESSLDEWMKA